MRASCVAFLFVIAFCSFARASHQKCYSTDPASTASILSLGSVDFISKICISEVAVYPISHGMHLELKGKVIHTFGQPPYSLTNPFSFERDIAGSPNSVLVLNSQNTFRGDTRYPCAYTGGTELVAFNFGSSNLSFSAFGRYIQTDCGENSRIINIKYTESN